MMFFPSSGHPAQLLDTAHELVIIAGLAISPAKQGYSQVPCLKLYPPGKSPYYCPSGLSSGQLQ
jgi:hypothetical protein